MKKIFALLLVLMMCISLVACTPSKGSKNYESHTELVAVTGYDYLYYDTNTKIVYIIFNEAIGYKGYGYMSPYYAPNGFPYLYDANNRVLIEIDR